ncbi:twin-arginine translocase TatA/TatE family subunit [Luteimicrobium sp. DT211]|uniref:twin-arginine translocase TatA/TatE family subunit n=1 Tax=Luteimicrobium sp. DT211 TaxID=3393412 RepID=UPI003CEAA13A
MLRNLTAWHLIIVVGVLVLLFGANKLPELAKGVGSSLKIFKNEVKELTEGDGAGATAAAGTLAPAESVAAPTAERAALPE